jgi:hypothetical protein
MIIFRPADARQVLNFIAIVRDDVGARHHPYGVTRFINNRDSAYGSFCQKFSRFLDGRCVTDSEDMTRHDVLGSHSI